MFKWKKPISLIAIFFVTFFAFVPFISAHVTVSPEKAEQGAYEIFTIKVPTEGDLPTTKMKIKIPDGVDISRVEPMANWSYEMKKDESGKVTSITWTAEGDGLLPGEFTQFDMQGKVGEDTTSLVWKAYQTYADGKVVEWVGAEGADTPASVTKVVKSMSDDQAEGSDSAITESTDTESLVPMYLSIAAIILGAIALILAIRKK